MLLVSLILAVVGLVALVAAVITNNEMIAWVCIGASSLGVILLIVDAIRERTVQPPPGDLTASDDATDVVASTVVGETDVGETDVGETDVVEAEDHPEELVHDEPEYDMPDDDEPEYAEPAEEAAMHILDVQPEPDR